MHGLEFQSRLLRDAVVPRIATPILMALMRKGPVTTRGIRARELALRSVGRVGEAMALVYGWNQLQDRGDGGHHSEAGGSRGTSGTGGTACWDGDLGLSQELSTEEAAKMINDPAV